ncbi:MAG TPA: hypothetical protein VF698_00440 [Thermoanaerobaculia bacterium]|jgi:hypothetical protein
MIRSFRVLCALAILASVPSVLAQAAPATAQEQADREAMRARLDRLQQQIEALAKEAEALRALLGETPAAPEPAPSDDLLSVEPVPATTPAPPPATAATAPTETPAPADELPTDVVNNTTPVTGNVFNPDISVIGNFLGHAGTDNPFEPRDTFALEEAEIGLQAFVDPYARAKFFLAFGPEGAEVEEGFAEFITLPYDLTAKAGKLKATFGKANTWHTHVRPWVDQPLVIKNFFGEEGLADSGVSATKIIPNPFAYLEATGEIFSGNAEGVFERREQNDLFYNAHLKFFKDLTESTNLEVGTSYALGTAAVDDAIGFGNEHSQFAGLDVSYRWKPLQTALRKGFIARAELMRNKRADQADAAIGFYTSLDYQFARRWITGLRLDQSDRPLDPSSTDRALSVSLTFRPSEFSQIRGQVRRSRYAHELDATEFLLQLQFAIGAHGAHTF